MAVLSGRREDQGNGQAAMNRPRVLMIGPGRDVKGGVTTVVNNYFAYGLDKNVDLCYLPTMEDGSKLRKLFVVAKAYMQFGALLEKCDILHVHMAAQASFDRKALFIERAKKAGKKIIIHEHAADFNRYFSEQVDEKKRIRIRRIFAMADIVIALSEEWADFYGKTVCDPGKIHIIHNGVPVPNYNKTDYCDRNVLVLGRLGERKGTYDLLKAIPDVLKEIPNAVFYLGGDGEEAECRKLAADLSIDSSVVFTGWVRDDEKDRYFKQCSTFILPSHFEGMPMSVLEAMSFGLACVSTNVGGIPRVIDSGKNGILIDAGKTDEISGALISVLSDEELRRKLGEAAKAQISDRFELGCSIKKLLAIYSLLSGSGDFLNENS